ncbi:MAG: fibronectin type III domain-containing protein [Huintestinicola sp.]|uniref:fibronectin type III domain-containing protein n=1 Tax=Huintestinicola sp. TaxID=2981661 RepID=UPI003F103F7B
MKYTMKITASLMAAAMSFSILGTAAAGAVDFTVEDGGSSGSSNTSGTLTPSAPATTSAVVQNAVPEFFNGCVKFTWTQVPSADKYAVKICNTDGTIVKTYYVDKKYTAVLVPETVFGVDYNSKKDFYACVIALKKGEYDNDLKTFYAPSASKFTIKSDMSEYPDYGAAQNITFMTNNGKLLICWKNPNDFTGDKDIFSVSVEDRLGKTVFSQTGTSCKAEVKGLKDGETYKVKIYNKSFSAMTVTECKFVSDVVSTSAGQSSSETPPKKGSEYTLPAPLSINVKPGNGKLTLSWSSVDEAYAYRIYMYDAKTKKYKKYKTVKSTKYTVKSLTNGKTYKFKIVALRYDSKTGKYTPGKASRAVSGTPKNPSTVGSKKGQV